MANNYTQGTVAPSLPLTDLHKGILDFMRDCCGDLPAGMDADDSGSVKVTNESEFWEFAEEHFPDTVTVAEVTEAAEVVFEGHDYSPGLDYEPDGDRYYLFAEDSLGDADLEWLEWVLSTLPEDEVPYITVEYAHTCSKMRPGEFGGGAWFITREGTEFVNTGSWLSNREAEEGAKSDKKKLVVLSDGETYDSSAHIVSVSPDQLERIDAGEKVYNVVPKGQAWKAVTQKVT